MPLLFNYKDFFRENDDSLSKKRKMFDESHRLLQTENQQTDVNDTDGDVDEDWKSTAAAGMLGLSTLLPQSGLSLNKTDTTKPKYSQSQPSNSGESIVDILKGYENSKDNRNGGYNKARQKWYPHRSIEGGSATIAYGHKILPEEDFSNGITDEQAISLLKKDIASKVSLAKKKMSQFDSFGVPVKNAIINALYRGDLGPKTIKLINADKWEDVPSEYLNHPNYKSGPTQIKNRMAKNAEAFASVRGNKSKT